MKRAAIVGQGNFDAPHQVAREPGFTTGMPMRHSGHSSRIPDGGLEGSQRRARHPHLGAAATPVDDGAGRQNLGARRAQRFDHFTRAAAGGDHILHHCGPFSGSHRESSPQRHLLGGRVPLGENEARAHRPGYLVADDQAPQGGRDDQVRGAGHQRAQEVRQHPAQLDGCRGMLQHQRALEVLGAVQSAGEPEMALEVGAGGSEQLQDGVGLRRHKGLLYH